MKRTVLIIALVAMGCGRSFAAEQIAVAQTSLDYTLGLLLESVDKLKKENQELLAVNEQQKLRIGALTAELDALRKEETRLLSQFSASEPQYEKKRAELQAAQVKLNQVRAESDRLDQEMTRLSHELSYKEKQDADMANALTAMQVEIERLRGHAGVEAESGLARLTKKRDELRDQSRQSLLSLQKAREEWLDKQAGLDNRPERVASLTKDRDALNQVLEEKNRSLQALREDIKEKDRQITEEFAPEKVSPAASAELQRAIDRMTGEIKSLRVQIARLEKQQAADRAKKTAAVEFERKQLEGRLSQSHVQANHLRAEIDHLKKEMVGRDKEKSAIESRVYGR